MNKSPTFILLFHSPDSRGIIYRITRFIFKNNGNIVELDQHVDKENSMFFMRLEWERKGFSIPFEELNSAFEEIGEFFSGKWSFRSSTQKERVAIFVSREGHCLEELLWRYKMGELPMDIKVVISNHEIYKDRVEKEKIPFYFVLKNRDNKLGQEKKELSVLKQYGVTTIILARYMQILTSQFVRAYPNAIINIHHSFLPAFVGSNPYKQAFDRGVKIVGATSHYVTEELDQGPIIEQDVVRISHRDSLDDIKEKGRDLERIVLAKAVKFHLEHRILVYGRKTIVFR